MLSPECCNNATRVAVPLGLHNMTNRVVDQPDERRADGNTTIDQWQQWLRRELGCKEQRRTNGSNNDTKRKKHERSSLLDDHIDDDAEQFMRGPMHRTSQLEEQNHLFFTYCSACSVSLEDCGGSDQATNVWDHPQTVSNFHVLYGSPNIMGNHSIPGMLLTEGSMDSLGHTPYFHPEWHDLH